MKNVYDIENGINKLSDGLGVVSDGSDVIPNSPHGPSSLASKS